MKKLLYLITIAFALLSCQTGNPDEQMELQKGSDVIEKESVNNYYQDWEDFRSAVIAKDKESVLFFALKSDQSLKDILEMSYDYIFDDQMIENIENMTYDDLGIVENDEQKKVLIIYYPSGSEMNIEDSQSSTHLFFEERPEGLRIVNFIAAG